MLRQQVRLTEFLVVMSHSFRWCSRNPRRGSPFVFYDGVNMERVRINMSSTTAVLCEVHSPVV